MAGSSLPKTPAQPDYNPALLAAQIREAAEGARDWVEDMPEFYAAVAEWLELEAHMCEVRGNSPEGHTFHALKVARAYLGAENQLSCESCGAPVTVPPPAHDTEGNPLCGNCAQGSDAYLGTKEG